MPQGKYSPDNPFAPKYSPDNPFVQQPDQIEGSAAFGLTAGETLTNNILATPSASGDLLAAGAAGIQGGVSKLFGGDFDFQNRFSAEQQKFPASALRSIPRPTVNKLAAGFRSIPSLVPGGESPGDAYGRNLGTLEAEDAAMRQQHPIATTFGEVGGDAFSLMLGRMPLAKGIGRAEHRLMNRKLIEFDPKTITLPQEVISVADRLWKSQGVSKMLRGVFRAGETGFEAAALDVLKGDNPMETAGYAAGSQAAGSVMLSFAELVKSEGKGFVKGGATTIVKVGAAALGVGTLIQIFRTLDTSEEFDDPTVSLASGFDHVIKGLLIGATAAAAGLHRAGRGTTAHPKLMDALASLPRGGVISVLEDYADAENGAKAKVDGLLDRIMTAPQSFDTKRLEEINQSIISGSLVQDIDKLTFQDAPPELK